MKTCVVLLHVIFLPVFLQGQTRPEISTVDITYFWLAFDQLSEAKNHADSVETIQKNYIDICSNVYSKYIQRSNISAEEYVTLFTIYPNYWRAIRPLTEQITNRRDELETALQKLAATIPGFKIPDIYFGIGCLRQGGTIKGNTIIIGAELAAADTLIDKSELSTWLKSVVGKTGDIVAMTAHESIHVQQTWFPLGEFFFFFLHQQLSLLNMAILEGSADYITASVLGLNINAGIREYGLQHECELWKNFEASIANDPFDYSKWLYNGNSARDMPADMGYFIGYQITQAYFNSEADKNKAYTTIFKRGKYRKVFEESDYKHLVCGS